MGLYDDTGWTTRISMWDILAENAVWVPQSHDAPNEYLSNPIRSGEPITDYVGLKRIGSLASRQLLQVVPDLALEDRHNNAPTLRALLQACADNPGRIFLSGYAIGPQRDDERLSVDQIWVYSEPLVKELEHSRLDPPDAMRFVVDRIAEDYHLDPRFEPDEVRVVIDGARSFVSLWWD